MKSIHAARTLILAAGLLFPTYAAADLYFGIGIGRTNNEFLPTFDPSAGESIVDQDNAVKAFVGFDLTPNLAFELDYADLNDLVKASSPGLSLVMQGKSIGFSLLGKWQVHPSLQMFGRLGATRWDTDLTVNADSAAGTGTAPMIGLGVMYRLPTGNVPLNLRLEWTQYQNVGQGVSTPTTRLTGQNVDAVWLSICYHLRLAPGP